MDLIVDGKGHSLKSDHWAHKRIILQVKIAHWLFQHSIRFCEAIKFFDRTWNLIKFIVLLFITHSIDHNESLHTSRQVQCRDVWKFLLWSDEHILNKSTANFDRGVAIIVSLRLLTDYSTVILTRHLSNVSDWMIAKLIPNPDFRLML